MALFQRKGGFLLSERWLAQNGTVALFERTMHRACFLDKPVQRDQALAVKAEQHARRPFRWQVRGGLQRHPRMANPMCLSKAL